MIEGDRMEKSRTLVNMVARMLYVFVAFIATFVITRIVVGASGSELYGFFSLSNDFVNYALIISVALNSMAGRFITVSYYNNDSNEVNQYFNSVFFANIILALVMAIPLLAIDINLEKVINIPFERITEIKLLFLIMFFNYLLTIISSVFSVSTFIKNRVDLDSYRAIESNIIKIVVCIVLYNCFIPNIIYVGIATLISTIYVFVVNIRYVKKLTPEIKIFNKSFFNKEKVKTVVSSGIWNSITRVGAILLNGLDLLIANRMVSSTAMGVLSVSKTLPKYLLTGISNFASVFSPKITIEYAQNNKDEMVKQINYSMKICGLMSNTAAIILIVLGKQIYSLWMPGQDARTLQILSIIAISGYIVLMPLEPIWSVITATNRVRISSIYLIIESVLTLSTVFILLPRVPEGIWQLIVIAGISSVYEVVRGLVFLPIFGAKCISVRQSTFYPSLIRSIVSFLIGTGVCYLLCSIIKMSGWLGLVINCIIVLTASLSLGYVVVLNNNEKKTINRLVISIVRKMI